MDKIEVTQADREAAAIGYYDWVSATQTVPNRMQAGEADFHSMVQAFARHRLATRTDATPVAEAWAGMEAAMQDPEYAWGWHCNLAIPIMDATGITHEQANMAAAHLMQHLWKCDITTHPHYEYKKSDAQSYAEFRIEADKEEDDALPDETHPPATDVAALVEAAKVVLPSNMAHIPEWMDGKHVIPLDVYADELRTLLAALAPFTKGQNDDRSET